MEAVFDRLFPLCRSITGNGLRDSFKILKKEIPLQLTEVPSGTRVFDWEVPLEWNIKDAHIITPSGKKICSFKTNNLHVVNYSVPVNKRISFRELNQHLHSLPALPSAIPYKTTYYQQSWGFCISHQERKKLPEKGMYQVFIDSSLKKGGLTYGDLVLKGKSDKEILISTYLCHPSMAVNELSGPLVTAWLYKKIASLPNRNFTYRFVIAPETIGVLSYLNRFGFYMKEKTIAGFVVTCVGSSGPFHFKESRMGDAMPDRLVPEMLRSMKVKFKQIPFDVGGSDERQYCSPGFNLPVVSLMRTPYKDFKEYHTSLDNKSILSFSGMEETVETYFSIIRAMEENVYYLSAHPFGEVNMGKRGLYKVSDSKETRKTLDLLFFLAHADGNHSLLDIARKRNLPFGSVVEIAHILEEKNLIIHPDAPEARS